MTFSPDGKSVYTGSADNIIDQWNIQPWSLFLRDGKASEVLLSLTNTGEFLWQLQRQGLDIVEKSRNLTNKPQDDYFFSYDSEFRPLLNPPDPGQSKFEQVLQWSKEQVAAQQ